MPVSLHSPRRIFARRRRRRFGAAVTIVASIMLVSSALLGAKALIRPAGDLQDDWVAAEMPPRLPPEPIALHRLTHDTTPCPGADAGDHRSGARCRS